MSLMGRWFALTYDRSMARMEKAGFRELRERSIGQAKGDVLEIGGGTGSNLTYYGPAVVYRGGYYYGGHRHYRHW